MSGVGGRMLNANEYSFVLFLAGVGHFFNQKFPRNYT